MSRRSTHLIALLLLLWTAVDLCVPGVCQSDGVDWFRAPADSRLLLKAAKTGKAASTAALDDCFCCCDHVVHQPHFLLRITSPDVFAEFSDFLAQPLDAVTLHYRPPRA